MAAFTETIRRTPPWTGSLSKYADLRQLPKFYHRIVTTNFVLYVNNRLIAFARRYDEDKIAPYFTG